MACKWIQIGRYCISYTSQPSLSFGETLPNKSHGFMNPFYKPRSNISRATSGRVLRYSIFRSQSVLSHCKETFYCSQIFSSFHFHNIKLLLYQLMFCTFFRLHRQRRVLQETVDSCSIVCDETVYRQRCLSCGVVSGRSIYLKYCAWEDGQFIVIFFQLESN